MSHEGKTSSIGGGGLMLGLAKLVFLVAAYATSIGLTHLISPTLFGRYYVVARLIAVPNMVIIQTLLFAVSRPMAAELGDGLPSYRALRRRGVRLAAVLGGATAGVFIAGAPLLSAALNDEQLTAAIQIVAPISLLYALYAINVGTLNATRQFRMQASLDMFMAFMKASLILGAAAAGLGLVLTLGGFTLASGLALMLSVVLVSRVRPSAKAQRSTAPPMARFAGVLVLFTAAVNLLQSADVLILKHFAQTEAELESVGFYATAQQVALVPYSLMNAVSLVMFPLIATLHAARDEHRVRAYVTETAKLCLLLLTFMSVVGSASAGDIQALLFPRAYGAAASDLSLLVWGFSGYSFVVTTAWILNGSERSRPAVMLVFVPLVLVFVSAAFLIPRWFTAGSATAVAVSGGVAAVAALIVLWKHFGATIPVTYALKVLAAVALVVIVARVWPDVDTAGLVGKVMILVKLTVLAAAFVAVVVVTRAVTIADIKGLRRAA